MQQVDGTTSEFDVGVQDRPIGRPVVYLDQNQWVDLARTATGWPHLIPSRRDACQRLTMLARDRRVVLPLSAGNLVEMAKKGGRQRTDVGRSMVELSRGWQMRSPLRIRAHELDTLMRQPGASPAKVVDVFTLEPNALWADRLWAGDHPRGAAEQELPAELAGLVARISWAVALAEVLLDPRPEVSRAGLAVATDWASSFHQLAQHMRGNPEAKRYTRDLTRTRMITDMAQDLALAVSKSGRTAESFAVWLREAAEADLSSQPALGRIREVLHLRLSNADDRWERNDLNDLLYLCSAAGYADVVVGERKTIGYLERSKDAVTPGAQVFSTMEKAIDTIERLAGVGT